MTVHAVVPTIGESPWLPALVHRLLEDGVDHVDLVVNRTEWRTTEHSPPAGERVFYMFHSGSIYHSWNLGVASARLSGAEACLVLNDDVELARGAAGLVAGALRSTAKLVVAGFEYRPHARETAPPGTLCYVSGTYRHGGIGGFAFGVNPRLCPAVDPRFEWWYGDDDLMFQVEELGGHLAIVTGAHVTHHSGTTGSRHAEWAAGAIARDTEAFRAKWGSR